MASAENTESLIVALRPAEGSWPRGAYRIGFEKWRPIEELDAEGWKLVGLIPASVLSGGEYDWPAGFFQREEPKEDPKERWSRDMREDFETARRVMEETGF